MSKECNKCGAQIEFKAAGKDHATGKVKWNVLNAGDMTFHRCDGSTYTLKTPTSQMSTEELKQKAFAIHKEALTANRAQPDTRTQKDKDIQKMHDEKMRASDAQTQAINNLADAIRLLAGNASNTQRTSNRAMGT